MTTTTITAADLRRSDLSQVAIGDEVCVKVDGRTVGGTLVDVSGRDDGTGRDALWVRYADAAGVECVGTFDSAEVD